MLEMWIIALIQIQNTIKMNHFKQLQLLNAEILKLFNLCQAINSKLKVPKGMVKLYLKILILVKILIGLDMMKMRIALLVFINSNLKLREAKRNDFLFIF